jgi:nicotinamide-nucleotide amidase
LSTPAELAGIALRAAGLTVVTAESCTGGGIAAALTDVPGSSQWVEGGYVTYSNLAKQRALGVRAGTLDSCGAVSEEVVREMAAGALAASSADLAVAVSGIAGPDGGTPEKPVGTVWFAWATPAGTGTGAARRVFTGGRDSVRRQSVAFAIERLVDLVWRDERTG